MRYQLTRDVRISECPWLDRPFAEGEVVYRFSGATYGVIGPKGEPCSLTGTNPFFELPADALEVFDAPSEEAA